MKRRFLLAAAAILPALLGLAFWLLPEVGGFVPGLFEAWFVVVLSFLSLWLLTSGLRVLLWRVGRRLAFSYFLIGILPIPLVTLLVAGLAYLAAGFFLGHVYRDAVHSVASELRSVARFQLDQLPYGRVVGGGSTLPMTLTYYRDGHKVYGDPRAPSRWYDWWAVETSDTVAPSPISTPFVALADGRPTLMAAVSHGRYGVLALYDGDLEGELSDRSGAWVELLRADEAAARPGASILVMGHEVSFLLPRPEIEGQELKDFFHAGVEKPSLVERPFLVWAEMSRPFLDLATGEPAAESVVASLTGSLLTVKFHLISRSAEVDSYAYVVLVTLAFVLFDIWVVAVLMAMFMIISLSRAVNRLWRATARVQAGDFSTRIEVERDDQLGAVQRSFNQMTESLEKLVVEAAQKEVLEKELEIARALQQSLLPGEMESQEGLAFATHFDPSAAIGGDYYDLLPSADGRLVVVVADVSGHGLPAGIRMAMVKSALQLLCEDECDPLEILRRVHRQQRSNGRGFVTASLSFVDSERGLLTVTNAGHTPTYVVRGSDVLEIALPSTPLGGLGESFAQDTVELRAGDAVVWLSDGLIEATDEDDEPFGYHGVVRSLEGLGEEPSPDGDAEAVRDRLLAALDRHTGGALPEDDRTVVVMVYQPPADGLAASTEKPEEEPVRLSRAS